MSCISRPTAGLDTDRPELERLADDTDKAARISDQINSDALATHQARVARSAARQTQGICTNCGERCMPMAVFCDVDCREDYEHRERIGGIARGR